MRLSLGWLLLLCVQHTSVAKADGLGAFVYVTSDDRASVYCSTLPVPTGVPVADAVVTTGGTSVVTQWQGLCTLPAAPADGQVAVEGRHPLTGKRIRCTATVRSPSARYGAVAGYFVREPDGALVAGATPAPSAATALYAIRVWLDDHSCVPMDDGHFLFGHVPPGAHVLRGEAICDGQVHQAEASVDVWAGRTSIPEISETSAAPAPPLSFQWVTTQCRWGSPTGFYIGGAVVNRNGRRPSGSGLSMTTYAPVAGLQTWPGRASVTTETPAFEDATVTATLHGTTISGQALSGGAFPLEERLKSPVNLDITPNPVVIGQPALIRWSTGWSATARRCAGFRLGIGDGVYGTPQTLSIRPYPGWSDDRPVYYPRNTWVLRAQDTALLRQGITYKLRVEAADTLDHGSLRQRCPAYLTFDAVAPDEVPPAPPPVAQTPLPVAGGCFDGFAYYAEVPQGKPLSDALVVSPCSVPYLVPAAKAVLTWAGRSPQFTGRTGHLHLEGVTPGTHSLRIAAENPTTGELFTTDVTAEFVSQSSYVPQDTQGTVITYLYQDAGRAWAGNCPEAGTPFLSSRVIVDGFPANPAQLQNLLPDSDGRVEVTLAPGTHRLRFEGIKDGQVWVAACNVDVPAGAVRSVSMEAAPVGRAGPLNVLGAQVCGNFGLDADSSMRVRACWADGGFPNPDIPGNPNPLMTFGPTGASTTRWRKIVDGWMWLHQPDNSHPGEWDNAMWDCTGMFKAWSSSAGFNVPSELLTKTPQYTFPNPNWEPVKLGMIPWIKTYPSPLIAGKPGIVYWGASPNPALYRFSARSSKNPRDLCPLGDPVAALTQVNASRVRVLTRDETRTWLDPAGRYAPYQLVVYAYDSPYFNCQRQRWLNYITTQNGVFTTGKWLRLQGEHGSIKVNGVPQTLPWSVQFDSGTTVALEAVPDKGYRFAQWSGSLEGTTNLANLTVNEDEDITVQFEEMPPVAPELTWTDAAGYKQDGATPDVAVRERSFRFSVTYSAEDGYPPLGDKVQLWIQRFDTATNSWVVHTKAALTGGAADYVAGGEYSGTASLGKGKYRYRFVARSSREGNLMATGAPCRWTAGPVVNNLPCLEWLGTPAFTNRGVAPDKAAAGTTFRFAVRYKDADGDLPMLKQLHVQRLGQDGAWQTRKRITLAAGGSRSVEDGRVYTAQTTLANGVYRYRFEMADYASSAKGPPTRWHNGPVIRDAPPILTWVGWQAYKADGVEPDAGGPGRYSFRVNYADSEGDAPVAARLVLKRPSGCETRHGLHPAPSGSWTTGRQLRVSLDLQAVGDYEYRFEVEDKDGRARTLDAARGPHSGPSISEGTGSAAAIAGRAQITALAATPTGLGAEIRFQLSAPAWVEARVLNLAGRPVRVIGRDSPCEAGLTTLVWNAANDSGLRVPGGLYLVEVTARDNGGGLTRGVTQVRVSR
jgi:hypothetical protein